MKYLGEVLLLSIGIILVNLVFFGGLMYVENILIDYPIAFFGLEEYDEEARFGLLIFWVLVLAYSANWYKQRRERK